MSSSRSESEGGVDPFLVSQFDRAVELVQTLPKSGPIQSSYEEKLALYSLYKQVIEGDVSGPRPGIFELLARSKWDAWKSREGISRDEAMAAYVNVLLKMLKRYKDRQDARDIMNEFKQARDMAAATSSSVSGSQEWHGVGSTSSSSPRDLPSREATGSSSSVASSSSSTSSSPPAPIPRHLPSLASSTDPTPRPTPAQSRFFEIPDPKLPPPDLSPLYIATRLPGIDPSPSSASGSTPNDDQPTVQPSRSPSRVQQPLPAPATVNVFRGPSLPLPMPSRARSVPPPRSITPPLPLPAPPISAVPVRPPLLTTTSVDSRAFSAALERIQASLSALHERLESLETATVLEEQRAHPLRTLLFPPGGGRRVGVPRLVWTLLKRTVTDAVLAITCISVWLLVTGQRGMRRSSVRDFWASIVRLLWRKWQQPTQQPTQTFAAPFPTRRRGARPAQRDFR